MESTTTLPRAESISSSSNARRTHPRYFSVVSGLLVAGMFVGFAKTLFLRSHFVVPPIPPYLYVHGIVLTAWFLLVFAQTTLVATRRTAWHRRLGVATAIVGALVVPISIYVIAHAAQRAHGHITPLLRLEVVGNLISLCWFAGFVGAAIHARRRPDVHKRLMIAACFAIYGPVFARLQLIYGWPTPPPAVIPAGLLVLGIYDRLSAGRFHPTTKWIALWWGAGLVLLGVLIATRAGDTIIHALQ